MNFQVLKCSQQIKLEIAESETKHKAVPKKRYILPEKINKLLII